MIGTPKVCVANDFKLQVKTLLWPFCNGFEHLLRQFGQFTTTKNANGHRILPVRPGGSTLIKKL